MSDTDLLASIGRIVVGAAILGYSIATLVAASEGLRGEKREERDRAIVASPGEAMRQFKALAETARPARPLPCSQRRS
jgi:hypothetical protein